MGIKLHYHPLSNYLQDARALLDELNKRSGVPVVRRTDQS
jgi:hypothetical protein